MGRDLNYIAGMKERIRRLGIKTILPSIYQRLKADVRGIIDAQYFFKNPYDLAKYEVDKHSSLNQLEILKNMWIQNLNLRIDARDPTYVPWAKSKLKEMKARMMLQGIDIMNKWWIVRGQHIFCQSASGYDYIRITGEVTPPDILFFVAAMDVLEPGSPAIVASLAMWVQKGTLMLKRIKYAVPVEFLEKSDRCAVQSNPQLTKHSAGLFYVNTLPTLERYGMRGPRWGQYGIGYNKLYIPTYALMTGLDQAFGEPPEDETIVWEARGIPALSPLDEYSRGRNWVTLSDDKKYLAHTNITMKIIMGEWYLSYQTKDDYEKGTYTIIPMSRPAGISTNKNYGLDFIDGDAPTCDSGGLSSHSSLVAGSTRLISTSTPAIGTAIAIMGEQALSVLTTFDTESIHSDAGAVAEQKRTNVRVKEVGFAMPDYTYKNGTVTTTTIWTGKYGGVNVSSSTDYLTEARLGDRILGTFTSRLSADVSNNEIVRTLSYTCTTIESSEPTGTVYVEWGEISNTTTEENIPATVYQNTNTARSGQASLGFLDYDYNTDVSEYIIIVSYVDVKETRTDESKIIILGPEFDPSTEPVASRSTHTLITKWGVLSSRGNFTLNAGRVVQGAIIDGHGTSTITGTVISGVSCHVNKYNMVYTYLAHNVDKSGNPGDVLSRVFGVINLDETIGLPVGHRTEFTVTPDNYSEFFFNTFPYLGNAAIGVHKK